LKYNDRAAGWSAELGAQSFWLLDSRKLVREFIRGIASPILTFAIEDYQVCFWLLISLFCFFELEVNGGLNPFQQRMPGGAGLGEKIPQLPD
jgi:hypothetical protein